ncbi:MAG TPA: HAD-IIIA family hydrolase [Oligoflexia bacterium]|nr:HAD-IIIA family hydrolase [Oligoflexia bacterium]HMP27908.1 HAD-IIIA family hydrolase [Oligoflexia bacterium]
MSSKIVDRDQAKEIINQLKTIGKKIGFTSGVFDILHVGHINYLRSAKEQCDFLIVAVNSDRSVKSYKDQFRPVIGELQRVAVVSALSDVDLVFLFDENNNRENIFALKPDFYFKAGDYSKEKLTSAPLVEEYGGKVVIIPIAEEQSTTKIIEKIEKNFLARHIKEGSLIDRSKPKPAIFVDRDGTINIDPGYVGEVERFQLYDGALEGLKKLRDAGFFIIIVTNQQGIALGHFTKSQLFKVHSHLMRQSAKIGLLIDRLAYCPHSASEGCECRKPQTGMIDEAVRYFNIDLANSFVIGDTTTDIQLAKNAGCRSVLVNTGKAGKDGEYQAQPDYTAESLEAAASLILNLRM